MIYKIPCSCGKVYIGETGRELQQRILEHQRAIRLCSNKTGLDRHVRETGHSINWSNITILGREPHWQKRKLKENLEIERNKTIILNDYNGYTFNQLWTKFLNPGNVDPTRGSNGWVGNIERLTKERVSFRKFPQINNCFNIILKPI